MEEDSEGDSAMQAAKATAIKEDAEKDLNEALLQTQPASVAVVPVRFYQYILRPALNVAEKALKALKLSSLQDLKGSLMSLRWPLLTYSMWQFP